MNVRERIWGFKPPRKPKGKRKAPEPVQLSLAHARTNGRGGSRKNAGRKKGERPNVRHRARAKHRSYVPMHVTMRRAKGLPSLRSQRLFRVVREAIRDSQREGFRIVHFSVQADHVHMIIEADDASLLTKGMRGFAIRTAHRVNRVIFGRRRGKMWGDRYHRHDLVNPREVRNALVYVLNNHMKHGEWEVGLIDPLSSAPGFKGWMHDIPPLPDPTPTVPASTWLLDEGWTTVGLGYLNPGEVPRAVRH